MLILADVKSGASVRRVAYVLSTARIVAPLPTIDCETRLFPPRLVCFTRRRRPNEMRLLLRARGGDRATSTARRGSLATRWSCLRESVRMHTRRVAFDRLVEGRFLPGIKESWAEVAQKFSANTICIFLSSSCMEKYAQQVHRWWGRRSSEGGTWIVND